MRIVVALQLLSALMLTEIGGVHALPPPSAASRHARSYVLRLRPGDDLLAGLRTFAREQRLQAAYVASCAGSATRTSVRFANQPAASVREGHFEVVSLSGTLSADGAHVHVAFADSTGATFGGHLMDGTRIYTTAEIVLVELSDLRFAREVDSTYGYHELVPLPRGGHR